jgi:LTXXQ motif family protein
MGKAFLRGGGSIIAVLLASVPFVTSHAWAAPGHGRGGAPAAAHAAPRIGAIGGGRSFSAPRITGHSTAHFSGAPGLRAGTAKLPSSSRITGAPHKFATAAAASHPGRLSLHTGPGKHKVITNTAFRSAFVRPRTFSGRFHGSHWPWWTGGIVIGWVGPIFWPYAYYDFFDYVFWPYVYDDFWVYAYEDVYYGVYGSYGYVDPALKRSTYPYAANSEQRSAAVCGENAPELVNWPIERISEVIEPTDSQRATLDELKQATTKAIDMLKAACPNDLPSVPTGRLAAMESRLQVMLEAVRTVRAPLDRLYASLGDEQKARFNAVAPSNAASSKKEQRDLARLCTQRETQPAGVPIQRIVQAVRPTEEQQNSLAELKAAAAKASERLQSSCPTYEALTPTGRVEAMEKRLEAMLEAGKMVQPVLANFYDSLSDEQKARFNTLGSDRRRA